MTGLPVTLTDVSYAYGLRRALTGVTATIRPGVVTGIVGRNGSGKSTLLNLIGGRRRPLPGAVLIDGRNPWSDAVAIANTCLARHDEGFLAGESLATTFNVASDTRPDFSYQVADRLVEAFHLDLRLRPERLSLGERSAFAASVAIASRCGLTMLDEAHLGMDAVARRTLWAELLTDYIEHPRTLVISSHELNEVEDLVEDVLVLVDGSLAAAGTADEVRERFSPPGRLSSLTDVLVQLTQGVTP